MWNVPRNMAALAGYRPHCGGYLRRSLVHDGAPSQALGFLPRTRFPAALPYDGKVLLRTRFIEPCLPSPEART